MPPNIMTPATAVQEWCRTGHALSRAFGVMKCSVECVDVSMSELVHPDALRPSNRLDMHKKQGGWGT